MNLLSKENCIRHYQWGERCEGWVFIESDGLSVKQERMPPGTAEQLHFHKQAQQFFFILSGTAKFEVEGESFTVNSSEGFHIPAKKRHRIINETGMALEFILSSQPSAAKDRFNCI